MFRYVELKEQEEVLAAENATLFKEIDRLQELKNKVCDKLYKVRDDLDRTTPARTINGVMVEVHRSYNAAPFAYHATALHEGTMYWLSLDPHSGEDRGVVAPHKRQEIPQVVADAIWTVLKPYRDTWDEIPPPPGPEFEMPPHNDDIPF